MLTSGDITKIALVNNHRLVREGLRELLQVEPDLEVVGEAGADEDAVALAEKHQPDILLLDMEIPNDTVIVTTQRILSVSPATKVIIISVYERPLLLANLLATGVKGYLLKTISGHELVAAIRGTASDDSRIIVSVSAGTLARVHSEHGKSALSERELTVLELAAKAMSNSQIAKDLELSEATVKYHMHKIFVKLGAVSRLDAVNKAVAAALIDGASS